MAQLGSTTIYGDLTVTGTINNEDIIEGDGTNKITVSDSEPSSPSTGDIWIDTSS